uniref:Ribosomal protein L16 n=1 Tax=Taxillus yadoriki TaxID=2777184 RepID=A0A7L8XLF8_9MAGN|nr:ribosomal protein L16 [Taxillus yadoriki]QOH97229.1 ribosomal protein L16 [Taxillus yadoriki]
MLSVPKTRFRKQHRRRMTGISFRGNRICFGKYALQALKPGSQGKWKQDAEQCHETRVGVERSGYVYFQTNQLQSNQRKLGWVRGKDPPNIA